MPTTAPFRHALRVYWEDTDAGGIVFYANYLKYFERARTEWLRSLGVEQQMLRERDGVLFVVGDVQLRFLRPARLDDLLDVTAQRGETGRVSMRIGQQAWRGADLLAEGAVRIGCVDALTLRPRRIPSDLLERLEHTA